MPPTSRRSIRQILAAYWVVLFLATHLPPIETIEPEISLGATGADKLIHFACYVFLTLLLFHARILGKSVSSELNLLASVGIALIYAVVDEAIQLVPFLERTASFRDGAANMVGTLCVLLVLSREILWWRPVNWRVVARTALVIGVPALLLLSFWPHLTSHSLRSVLSRGGVPWNVDKLGHFLAAMVLTWLVPMAQPFGRSRPKRNFFGSLAFVAVAALLLERAQIVIGRGVELADIRAHGFGMAAALAVWAVAYLVTHVGKSDSGLWRSATDPKSSAARGDTSFVGHATLVGVLTLVSRLTGLVRDAVLAAALGLGGISDAFFMAFLIPNLFRRLFGEGALTVAFIPTYAQLVKRDPELARRVACVCIALLMIVLGGLTVVGEAILAAMSRGNWSEDSALVIRLAMIMLPYMPLICLVALISGILQVHRRFGPPATAPILLNLSIILGTLFAFDGVKLETHARSAVAIIGYCVVIGGVVQLIWQVPAFRRVAPVSLSARGTGAPLRRILVSMLPMLVGLAVFQVNAFLDSLIAFGLSPRDADSDQAVMSLLGHSVTYPIQIGAVAALQWAQRLYQFPLGVFGIAIATAVFPVLVETAADPTDPHRDSFASVLRRGLRLTVFIGLPATVGLVLVRQPLTRLIYQRGQFSVEDAGRVATILAGYGSAVWAYSLTHVVIRAFYALQDTRRPLIIALWMVGLNLSLNLVLIWPLGAAGLAWSTAFSAATQCLLLLRAIRRHVQAPVDHRVWASWARTAVLAAMMAVVLISVRAIVGDTTESFSALEAAIQLTVLVVVGAAVFIGGAWLTGVEELRWLWRRSL